MIAKLAANAYDLVYNMIDRKQAIAINASHVKNNKLKRTQGGLKMKTSNYIKFPTATISTHKNIEINEADIIQEAQ